MRKNKLITLLSCITMALTGLTSLVSITRNKVIASTKAWNFDGVSAVAGAFNDWSTTTDVLQASDSSHASLTKILASGTYEFKIILNGEYLSMNGDGDSLYEFHKDFSGPTNIYKQNRNFKLNANASSKRVEVSFNITLSGDNASLSVTQKAAYTLTFDMNGANETYDSIEKGSGASIGKPDDPTKDNYVFTGWKNTTTNTITGWPFILNDNYTLEAQWADETNTVTFHDANGNVIDTQEVDYGEAAIYSGNVITLPASSGAKSYNYNWVTSKGGSTVANLDNVTSDMDVYLNVYPVYATGRSVVFTTDGTFSAENAYKMTYDSTNSQDVYVPTLSFGERFKIAWVNNDGSISDYAGYSTMVIENSAAQYCFSKNSDDDFVCYAGGEYSIYCKKNESTGNVYKIYINFNGSSSRNAEQFAARLMHYDNTANTCQDRFYDMRSYFLGLSADEQTAFKAFTSSSESQFSNAYARYTAWARALGEDPWTNAKAPNAIYGLKLFNQVTENSTWIIAVVALVGVSSIGCFIFYKKRKEN